MLHSFLIERKGQTQTESLTLIHRINTTKMKVMRKLGGLLGNS